MKFTNSQIYKATPPKRGLNGLFVLHEIFSICLQQKTLIVFRRLLREQSNRSLIFMYRRRSAPFKFDKACEMRHNPTPAEERMWEILKSQVMPNFPNHIFRRQWVAYGYILDFYCPILRLGLEIDGDIHDDRRGYDEERDSNLAR